jgi:nitrite reductase/ring-hydroxylating ferredoxin subunit
MYPPFDVVVSEVIVSDITKTWVRICPLDNVPTGKALNLNINGQRLILARCGETLSVLQGFCTHMLYPLAGARIQDCTLTCGLHHSKFDIRDGSVIDWSTLPGLTEDVRDHKVLRTFETRVEDGAVFVLWPTTDPDTVRVKV